MCCSQDAECRGGTGTAEEDDEEEGKNGKDGESRKYQGRKSVTAQAAIAEISFSLYIELEEDRDFVGRGFCYARK